MGFNLTRVGGRNDRGVDLHGAWTPPTSRGLPVRAPLEVYVQCKVERCRAGPKYMRELEGTINATHTPLTPPIGILASTTPCTPGLRQHMMLSRLPLAYCCIEPHRRGGFLLQFLWNASVGDLIGRGVGVTTRYIPSSNSYGVDEIRREAVLTIDGHIIDFENAESPEEEEEGWEVANIV